ncbi:helix-turn-helix transcriptional regulator [Amycolatopsis endophytica]|uniref:Transcriptional regulator with XRE-family HTH domain n=1 Tax=Amycolatopsis endophytica TaxID=860233 RepID=A0A853B100_9PSEU|nr:helix-turn-helix transcriptional regulator [Amycolatopsis endophytica]NYI88376.1 transcriptional regulator with XRE-family HTH domain [Amycolatopsis endophytica]
MSNPRSRELGAYLRARRDRLSPEDVGLPRGGGRRRVTGLRREEVAVLANVGSTWYAWLEQGRDVRPSVEVLAAIADALRLSTGERRHLFLLGGHPGAEQAASCERVSGEVRALLDSLSPHPAVVMNPWFEPVAYNASFRFLIDDLEALPIADRNCAYLHFTHPDWIAGHADHEQECAAVVAKLRAYYGESITDPAWEPLLGRLREESPLFVRLWDRAEVSTEPRVKRIRSLHVGTLFLRLTTMLLQENPRTRVVVYQPDDRTTLERLEELAARIARGAIDGPAMVRQLRLRA